MKRAPKIESEYTLENCAFCWFMLRNGLIYFGVDVIHPSVARIFVSRIENHSRQRQKW